MLITRSILISQVLGLTIIYVGSISPLSRVRLCSTGNFEIRLIQEELFLLMLLMVDPQGEQPWKTNCFSVQLPNREIASYLDMVMSPLA